MLACLHEQISIIDISDRLKNSVNRMSSNYPDFTIDITEDIIKENILSATESIQLVSIIRENALNSNMASET
jgi:hypothetical protein